jgi:hypothetical protein
MAIGCERMRVSGSAYERMRVPGVRQGCKQVGRTLAGLVYVYKGLAGVGTQVSLLALWLHGRSLVQGGRGLCMPAPGRACSARSAEVALLCKLRQSTVRLAIQAS